MTTHTGIRMLLCGLSQSQQLTLTHHELTNSMPNMLFYLNLHGSKSWFVTFTSFFLQLHFTYYDFVFLSVDVF